MFEDRYGRFETNSVANFSKDVEFAKKKNALSEQKSIAEMIDNEARLKAEYQNAFKYINKIAPFSYFGFKLEDVKNGTLSLEEFLKELEQYLKSTQR